MFENNTDMGIGSRIYEDAAASFQKFDRAYVTKYCSDHLPTNIAQAQNRESELKKYRIGLEATLTKLKQSCKSAPVDGNGFADVRSQLIGLLETVRVENTIVQTYLREQSTLGTVANQVLFLASLVSRGKKCGLVLTSDEERRLDLIVRRYK